jgi:hypothetical protein
MRKMVKGNLKLKVVEHIILRNMWEYYILADEPDTHAPDPDIVYALVMGDHDEIGTVSLSEIGPHIFTRTTELNTIFPAAGYSWADELPAETGAELGFTGQGCPDYPLD